MENLIKTDDLGVPLFLETLTSIISRHLITVIWMILFHPPKPLDFPRVQKAFWNRGSPAKKTLSKRYCPCITAMECQTEPIYIYDINIYTYNIYIWKKRIFPFPLRCDTHAPFGIEHQSPAGLFFLLCLRAGGEFLCHRVPWWLPDSCQIAVKPC